MPSALDILLYDQLTRGRSLSSETGLRAIMRDLLTIAGGSARKAAALAGVSKSAWYSWAKGDSQPSARAMRKLHATLPMRRRARLPRGREKWMRGKPKIKLTALTFVKSPRGKKGDDVRRRTFEPWPYMPAGALGPVLDAFLNGADMADVGAVFVAQIEMYYGGVTVDPDQVESLEIIPRNRRFET